MSTVLMDYERVKALAGFAASLKAGAFFAPSHLVKDRPRIEFISSYEYDAFSQTFAEQFAQRLNAATSIARENLLAEVQQELRDLLGGSAAPCSG